MVSIEINDIDIQVEITVQMTECVENDPNASTEEPEQSNIGTEIIDATSKAVVTTIFWARVLCSLAAEDACFRMRITLGVVLIRSLVSHVCVPECSWNGFGMRPYLLVQEKFV